MVLSCYYQVPVRKMIMQADHDRCYSLVKLLCICFCYSNQLNHVKPVLNNIFFQKLCVIKNMSIRWSEKNHKAIGKVEMSKRPTVNPLF